MTYWGFLPGVLELCWLNRVSHCTCYHPSHCKYGVYVCGACMCVCTHMHTHTHMHAEVTSVCHVSSITLYPTALRQGLTLNWKLIISSRLTGLWASGTYFLTHPNAWATHRPAMPSLFVSSGALDSGPHTCIANALSPWTLSPAFLSILQALFLPFLLNSR